MLHLETHTEALATKMDEREAHVLNCLCSQGAGDDVRAWDDNQQEK